jgi:hypothetical protein
MRGVRLFDAEAEQEILLLVAGTSTAAQLPERPAGSR